MIVKEEEIDSLSQPKAQQDAVLIKQKFDLRRTQYQICKKNRIYSLEIWQTLEDEIKEFEEKFLQWNNQWSQTYQSNNLTAIKSFLKEGNTIFEKMENFLKNQQLFDDIETSSNVSFRKTLHENIETKFLELSENFTNQIKEGINSLVRLKGELNLTKNFGEKISKQVESSKYGNWIFFSLFLSLLFLYGLILIVPFFYSPLKEFEYWQQWGIRLTISIPTGLILYFVFNQYRFYKLSYTKYQHLETFIGGGITSLHSLLDANSKLKDETSKSIADLFISIDDILKPIVNKNSPYPFDLKDLNKSVNDLLKNLESISKIKKDNPIQ